MHPVQKTLFLSENTTFPPNNGVILTITHIINNVMSSAAKAELGATYISAREASYIHIISKKWETNNIEHQFKLTAPQQKDSLIKTIQPKRTKAMDM